MVKDQRETLVTRVIPLRTDAMVCPKAAIHERMVLCIGLNVFVLK